MKDRVVFRVFKKEGDLIALFPHDIITPAGHRNSYQRIGQHGAADYTHCIKATRPAKLSEFRALKLELEQAGYDLEIRARK